MNLPSGLVFYLDFQYGTKKDPFAIGDSMYGNEGGNAPFGNTNTGGLYGAGRFGYSINNTESALTATSVAADWSDVNYDSDLSASVASAAVAKYQIPVASLSSNYDTEAIYSFRMSGSNAPATQYPQFTKINGSNIEMIATSGSTVSVDFVYSLQPTDQYRGDFEDGNTALNGENNPISIPEVNVQMKSSGS